MKLGVARYGPCAPLTFQFGKYDTFTSTGTPGLATSKETPSSVVTTFETPASSWRRAAGPPSASNQPQLAEGWHFWLGVARGSGSLVRATRDQSSGPSAVSTTSQSEGLIHQHTA